MSAHYTLIKVKGIVMKETQQRREGRGDVTSVLQPLWRGKCLEMKMICIEHKETGSVK
jgi:hypothetical protein